MKPKSPEDHKAVLFKSRERFVSFQTKLEEFGIDYTVLDFNRNDWICFDYSNVDFIIYYPSFQYSSNHPLAVQEVYDNITFIYSKYRHLKIFPDPKLANYYNDKYRQYLFLISNGYPMPDTIPLCSKECVELADEKLGYPMVIKNRYGAGGGSVFRVFSKKELANYFNLSKLSLFNLASGKYLLDMLSKRIFYYWLIKGKNMVYPFLSSPLLAQRFVKIDRDLKTVVGNGRVVEAHWRIKANEDMWKVNIDGGGIGEWSEIPGEAIRLSERLAKDLDASWVNLDIIVSDAGLLITEFSPVWHHYAYKEKPSFVYKEDYNISVPLNISLDLERIVIESLIEEVEKESLSRKQMERGLSGEAPG